MTSKEEQFIMCLVAEDSDVIVVTKNSCKTCLQNRGGFTVLESWKISKEDVIEIKKEKGKVLNCKCQCNKYETICT